MSRTFFLVIALACLVPAGARGQEAGLPPLDTASAVELRAIVNGASSRGLPGRVIVGEAWHGAQAGVPGPRIVAAARNLADRLESARSALGRQATPEEIRAGAEALMYGATPRALTTIRAASAGRPVAVALGLLTQLIQSRVPLSRAVNTVVDLIRRGADSRAIADLGNNLGADVARGESAEQSLAAHLQTLTAVLPPSGASVTTSAPGTISVGVPKKP